MTHRIITTTWLTAVWVMLWESLTWANVLGGMAVALLVVWMIPAHRQEFHMGFRPFAAVRLLGYFTWKLVEASGRLTWEIFTPRNHVNAAVVSVPLQCRIPGVATVVANMVSLTPGTVTIDIDEDEMVLFIHVLHLRTVEEERAEVLRLESMTLAAFPPRDRAEAIIDRMGGVR